MNMAGSLFSKATGMRATFVLRGGPFGTTTLNLSFSLKSASPWIGLPKEIGSKCWPMNTQTTGCGVEIQEGTLSGHPLEEGRKWRGWTGKAGWPRKKAEDAPQATFFRIV